MKGGKFMSFLNNVSQKISQISHTTVQKTKDMTDVAQLKKDIAETDKEIHNLFDILGQRYYELFGSCPASELTDTCNAIRDLCVKLNGLQSEIDAIKATIYCPSCGTKITDDSAFCTNCGQKLKED